MAWQCPRKVFISAAICKPLNITLWPNENAALVVLLGQILNNKLLVLFYSMKIIINHFVIKIVVFKTKSNKQQFLAHKHRHNCMQINNIPVAAESHKCCCCCVRIVFLCT